MVEAGWELLTYKELTGSTATTLTTDAFALKENLRVVVKINGKASDSDVELNVGLTGSINASGSNYRVRRAKDGGSTSFGSAGDSIRIVDNSVTASATSSDYAVIDIVNVDGKPKLFLVESVNNAAGAGNIPHRLEAAGWWKYNSDNGQLNIIRITSSTMDLGASITVYGQNTEGSTAKDKSTITDVPVGTRYEETDTRKIFRRKGADFPQTVFETGTWTGVQTTGSANIPTNSGGTITCTLSTQNQDSILSYDLGTTVNDSTWTMRAKMVASANTVSIAAGCTLDFGLSAGGNMTGESGSGGATDWLTARHHFQSSGTENSNRCIDGTFGSGNNRDSRWDTGVNNLWIELQRVNDTTFNVKWFSDEFVTQLGNTSTVSPSTSLTGLRYVVFRLFVDDASISGSATLTFSEINIWNSTTVADSWVEKGTA